MATFAGVDAELADRGRGVIFEGGPGFWLSDGARSLELQWYHYNRMQEAQRMYGARWRNYAPLAAYPGTSDHGKSPALAVDIACQPHLNARRDELFDRWGLWQNVDGEKWHGVKHPKRGTMPKLELPKDEDMPDEYTAACMSPSQLGRWVLKRDGAVEAHNFDLKRPIPHFGSVHDFPKERDVPGRYFIAIEPIGPNDDDGYFTIANDGYVGKFNKDTRK